MGDIKNLKGYAKEYAEKLGVFEVKFRMVFTVDKLKIYTMSSLKRSNLVIALYMKR